MASGREASLAGARKPHHPQQQQALSGARAYDTAHDEGRRSRAESMTPSTTAVSALMQVDQGNDHGFSTTPLRIRLRPQAPLEARPLLLATTCDTTLGMLMQRIASLLKVEASRIPGLRIEVDGFTVALDEPDIFAGDVIRETDVVNVCVDDTIAEAEDSIIKAAVDALVRPHAKHHRPIERSSVPPMVKTPASSAENIMSVQSGSLVRPQQQPSLATASKSTSSDSSSSDSSSTESSSSGSGSESGGQASEDDGRSASSSSFSSSSSSESGSSMELSSRSSPVAESSNANPSQPLQHKAIRSATPPSGWVPPGQGKAQTRRSNKLKRKREREQKNEERQQLFVAARDRAQARSSGGLVLRPAPSVPTLKSTAEPYAKTWPEQGVIELSSSSEYDLPPGGGSLGFADAVKTPGTVSHNTLLREKSQVRPKAVPPPTLRGLPIPEGVRLRRFDCDDCFNAWPIDETGEALDDHGIALAPSASDLAPSPQKSADTLYAAFKAEGQAAIAALRARDEHKDALDSVDAQAANTGVADCSEELILPAGLPLSFGKPPGWEGHGLVVSHAMRPEFSSTPGVSLESKPPLVTGAGEQPSTSQDAHKAPGPLFLDYRDPKDAQSGDYYSSSTDDDGSMAQSLQRLRELRDLARTRAEQHQAAQQLQAPDSTTVNTSLPSSTAPVDLAAIRSAALATRKRKAALMAEGAALLS